MARLLILSLDLVQGVPSIPEGIGRTNSATQDISLEEDASLALVDSLEHDYALGTGAHHLCAGLWVVGRDYQHTPHEGDWEGERILREGWGAFVRTPASGDLREGYGGSSGRTAGASWTGYQRTRSSPPDTWDSAPSSSPPGTSWWPARARVPVSFVPSSTGWWAVSSPSGGRRDWTARNALWRWRREQSSNRKCRPRQGSSRAERRSQTPLSGCGRRVGTAVHMAMPFPYASTPWTMAGTRSMRAPRMRSPTSRTSSWSSSPAAIPAARLVIVDSPTTRMPNC